MGLSPKGQSRLEAVTAGWTGDHTKAQSLASSPNSAVRAAAYGSLQRIGNISESEILNALSDTSADVRQRGLIIAASQKSLRSENIDAAVLAALEDDDDEVIEVAAFCAGERFEPIEDSADVEPSATQRQVAASIVSKLSELTTSHDDLLVRESSVAALGAIGDPAGLNSVIAAASDKPAIRRRAAIALVAFDAPEAGAALLALTEDRDWQVRQIAEDLTVDDG